MPANSTVASWVRLLWVKAFSKNFSTTEVSVWIRTRSWNELNLPFLYLSLCLCLKLFHSSSLSSFYAAWKSLVYIILIWDKFGIYIESNYYQKYSFFCRLLENFLNASIVGVWSCVCFKMYLKFCCRSCSYILSANKANILLLLLLFYILYFFAHKYCFEIHFFYSTNSLTIFCIACFFVSFCFIIVALNIFIHFFFFVFHKLNQTKN